MKHLVETIGKRIFRKAAPRSYWSMCFSRLCEMFPEEELYLIPSLCDARKTSIDIGAAGGVYTAHILHSSRDCLAFEPRPGEACKIEQMAAYLSLPVRVERVALSDTPGRAKLRILASDGGRSTIEEDNPLSDPDGSARLEIPVPRACLDDYQLDAVGFIKIDVEGHELAVLRGSSETIERCLPSLLIEIEERHKPNSIRDVSHFLTSLGYSGYFLLEGNLLPLKEWDLNRYQNSQNMSGWKNHWKRYGIYVNNFFFVRPEFQSRLEKAARQFRGPSSKRSH